MMNKEIEQFIRENTNLINQNTKEGWEEIYQKLPSDITGKFTETMLECGIDPAKILGHVPRYYLCESNISNYKIPDIVKEIGSNAFSYCTSLENIVIPNGVTNIDNYAFAYCYSLTSVMFGENSQLTSIGDSAFCLCASFISIEIPNSVTSIGEYAFSSCDSLTSVTIGNGIITIDEDAFYDCDLLTEINFKGTKEEAIKCGIGDKNKIIWRENSLIKKIVCTDGVIEL